LIIISSRHLFTGSASTKRIKVGHRMTGSSEMSVRAAILAS
jgi:hypothetical protein